MNEEMTTFLEAEAFPVYTSCHRCHKWSKTQEMLIYTKGYICQDCWRKELEDDEAENYDSSYQDGE